MEIGVFERNLYGLCLAAVKSKTESKPGVKMTYRGETERQMRTSSNQSVQVCKAIFLIQFKMTKAESRWTRGPSPSRSLADSTNFLIRA